MVMKEMSFRDRVELNDFIGEKRDEMYQMIFKSIDRAFALGSDVAEVVVFYLEDEDVYIDMISERKEWSENLSLALEYYVSVELYEKCAKIKALIDKIEKSTDA